MNTKLSIAFLSGVSLFLSVGAFAVSEDLSSDDLNWSYAMGDTKPVNVNSGTSFQAPALPATGSQARNDGITCTNGCPGRPSEPVEPLTLTYEDEALPLAERVNTFSANDRYNTKPAVSVPPVAVQNSFPAPVTRSLPTVNPVPQIETHYVTTPAKTQYPITRQYPISVQYPITVQRNMTVEQPVLMQQPIVVRRPVIMQQDIMVQRQPTVIQHQPMVMQQQPSFIQQKPIVVQAPAGSFNPAMLGDMNNLNPQGFPPMTLPSTVTLPQQSIPLPQQNYAPAPLTGYTQPLPTPDQLPAAQLTAPDQAQAQAAPQVPAQQLPPMPMQQLSMPQMPAQPMYQPTAAPMYIAVPMAQPMPMAMPMGAQPQQPVYQN